MIGEFSIGRIYVRLITAGLIDGGEEIVGDKAMGDCTEKSKGPGMGTGLVGK
jgi:hypothetical protein